jgi:hypothetical protein
MRSRMHENHYHLIINNCEHLCSWAITGIESSTQVERMMHRLTTIGYVSSIMSYMNGMMLTVATTCFALVLYIKRNCVIRQNEYSDLSISKRKTKKKYRPFLAFSLYRTR